MLAAASPHISAPSYESGASWRADGERRGRRDGRNLSTGLSKFQWNLYHWCVCFSENRVRGGILISYKISGKQKWEGKGAAQRRKLAGSPSRRGSEDRMVEGRTKKSRKRWDGGLAGATRGQGCEGKD